MSQVLCSCHKSVEHVKRCASDLHYCVCGQFSDDPNGCLTPFHNKWIQGEDGKIYSVDVKLLGNPKIKDQSSNAC